MSVSICQKCGEYIFTCEGPHTCKPAFECIEDLCDDAPPIGDESSDDVAIVHAMDAESAAEKFAEEIDSQGDYPFANAGCGVVWVRPISGGKWEKFRIEAEQVVEYSAQSEGEAQL